MTDLNIPIIFTQLGDIESEEQLELLAALKGTELEKQFDKLSKEKFTLKFGCPAQTLAEIVESAEAERVEFAFWFIFRKPLLGLDTSTTVDVAFSQFHSEQALPVLLKNRPKDQFLSALESAWAVKVEGDPVKHYLDGYTLETSYWSEEGLEFEWECDFSSPDVTVSYDSEYKGWNVTDKDSTTSVVLLQKMPNPFEESPRGREKALYYLSDEDFQNVGYDPAKIGPEALEDVAAEIAQSFDDSFQTLLLDALETWAPGAKITQP